MSVPSANEEDEHIVQVAGNELERPDAGGPPVLSASLHQDERYFMLLVSAIRQCKDYRPKFGYGKSAGFTLQEFQKLYGADPFYHWIGLASPLLYASHRVAGGMTSIYRQIGIGCEWIFSEMLQDCFGLTPKNAGWSYSIEGTTSKRRTITLDGKIELEDVRDTNSRQRVADWMSLASKEIGIPNDTITKLKGIVFEVRQGYKSKDAKRQNADIANAVGAYAHLFLPVLLLFSTQIDLDVAQRYKENLWLLLMGTTDSSSLNSTYAFCREVMGYDLSDFLQRYSSKIKTEVEGVLESLLSS